MKELQDKVDRLERERTFDSSLTVPQHHRSLSQSAPSSSNGSPEERSHNASKAQHDRWLRLPTVSQAAHFVLDATHFSYAEAVDLFEHFEKLYYPHFAILEPVTSLQGLLDRSPLLFWTIMLVATRHHTAFSGRWEVLKDAHVLLYGKVCQEMIQSLLDIQAILLICTWPDPVKMGNQAADPSWMQLGQAINAARQMGLDKRQDEMLFGARKARFSLAQYSRSTAKLTWLKCFELEVQNSCWYGHTPLLAVPQYLRSIVAFCNDPDIPRDYAAVIEVHVQTAQYLDSANDTEDGRLTATMVRMASRALDAVKTKYTDSWSVNAERALVVAKQYLFALRLTTIRKQSPHEDVENDASRQNQTTLNEPFAWEALQAARVNAIKHINLLSSLSMDMLQSESIQNWERGTRFLPGYPKFIFQMAYFSGVVLLKYIDSVEDRDTEEAQSAQNGFTTIYRLFASCPNPREMRSAAKTLEIAGRAVGHGHVHLDDFVTTRMAAGLIYSVIWVTGKLRGKAEDPEWNAEASQTQLRGASVTQQPIFNDPFPGPADVPAIPAVPPVQDSGNGAVTQQEWESILSDANVLSANGFPFGEWDNAVYDNWMADPVHADMMAGFGADAGTDAGMYPNSGLY